MHARRVRKSGIPGPPESSQSPRGVCQVDGCDRPHFGHGYCTMHAWRVRRTGEAGPPESTLQPVKGLICALDGCDLPVNSLGLCKLHYERQRRDGHPGDVNRRTGVRGLGYINSNGYRIVYRDGCQMPEHRVVMEEVLGRLLEPFEHVHHRNGIKTDNQPENLELWVSPTKGRQPFGQRVADLVAFVAEHYPDEVRALLG